MDFGVALARLVDLGVRVAQGLASSRCAANRSNGVSDYRRSARRRSVFASLVLVAAVSAVVVAAWGTRFAWRLVRFLFFGALRLDLYLGQQRLVRDHPRHAASIERDIADVGHEGEQRLHGREPP